MAKLTISNLTTLGPGSAVTTINSNNDAIEAAMEKTLSRDGTSPNSMESNLDMNSYRIENLVAAVSDTEPVRLAEMNTELAALETTVQTIATTTQGYLNSVTSLYDEFDDRYLGNKASDPTLDNDGNTLITGALYFNTTTGRMKVYNGSTWDNVVPAITSYNIDDLADVTITSAANGDLLKYNGSAWVDSADTIGLLCIFDGGGSALTTSMYVDIEVPFTCTIERWTLLGDQSGSVEVYIWKDTYDNFPPTIADSIVAAAPPTVTAAAKNQSSTLTGWTTSISAGDILRVGLTSVSTFTKLTLSLKILKT